MPREEPVDLVDAEDRVVGTSTVGECLVKGLLHRAVAVLVLRRDGSVLLQKRSLADDWQPGMWTLSCTGHVKKGESYDDAAARELEEEIGLRTDIRLLKKYLLPPVREGPLTENEWVALFLAKSDEEAKVDLLELEEVRDFSRPELKRMMAGGQLVPDAFFLLTEYLRTVP